MHPAPTMMSAIPATALLTGLLGLLLVLLAANVSRLRMALKVSIGDGGDARLSRAIRLHGNTAEHVPIFLLLAAAYEFTAGADALFLAMATLFVVARALFTWGLAIRTTSRQRMAGAGGTYLAQFGLALGLLLQLARQHL